ncbi:MAG: hypothetical protein D6812_17040 [Deltaproteobacteria bacterium]|nr:MAG: hypothetical protein D6812_17040 [Deltaproteobacteria bacterium]
MGDFPSESVEKRWKVLQQRYREGLPDRLREMARYLRGIADPKNGGAHLEALHRIAHGMAGSSGIFGFPHLGICARELERLLRSIQEENRRPDSSEETKIADLIEELERIAAETPPEGKPV